LKKNKKNTAQRIISRAGHPSWGTIFLSREQRELSRTIPSFGKKEWRHRTRS